MHGATYLLFFVIVLTKYVWQDAEGCQSYKNILYSRSPEKKIPSNSTGHVKNQTDGDIAGDGSGGAEVIPNKEDIEKQANDDAEKLLRGETLVATRRRRDANGGEDLFNWMSGSQHSGFWNSNEGDDWVPPGIQSYDEKPGFDTYSEGKPRDILVLPHEYSAEAPMHYAAEERTAYRQPSEVPDTCDAVRYQLASGISDSCSGYKLAVQNSWPWESFGSCFDAVKVDPDCGDKFFLYPVSGKCVCEKKGYECTRSFGFSTEFKMNCVPRRQSAKPENNDFWKYAMKRLK